MGIMGQPLDRKLAFFYGQFVDGAYAMYERDPHNLTPEPQTGDIPDTFEMVAWIDMSDFILWDKVPKFYGIMARNRVYRHEYIVAIRGTKTLMEWADDAFALLTPFKPVPGAGRVAKGFDQIYSSLQVVKRRGVPTIPPPTPAAVAPAPVASLQAVPHERMSGTFAEQLEQLADSLESDESRQGFATGKIARPPRGMIVTGHSLGSALATLFVIENKDRKKFDITTSCTFASPRVGDAEFVRRFDEFPITSWRIVNTQDLVPRIPFHIPLFFPYEHVNTEYDFSSAGVVKWNPVCWHSMKTYLHWLDPASELDANCKK